MAERRTAESERLYREACGAMPGGASSPVRASGGAFRGGAAIVKFAANYHGHADALLVKAGSGVATLGLPDSPGVPAAAVRDTLTAPYNDLAAIEELFDRPPGQVAAVIVEPVAGNMGLVLPVPGFLEGLRALTEAGGA